MALTLPRWIAAAVAGALVILAVFLSRPAPRARPESPRQAVFRAERRAAKAADEAVVRLQGMRLRDSVRAALARLPATDTSRLITSGNLPASIRQLDHVVAARLAMARAQSPTIPIDIAFVLDTASVIPTRPVGRTYLGVTHVLPENNRVRCVAIARHQVTSGEVEWRQYLRSTATSRTAAARILGPCAFYEAFGAPGPQIDRWLNSGAWQFGIDAALRSPPAPHNLRSYSWEPLWSELAGWPVRRFLTSAGYRCLSGVSDACARLVLEPASDTGAANAITASRGAVEFNSIFTNDWYVSLGPESSQLLADMARSLGPDRFRRFWTSAKSPEEAFRDATGDSIGEWTVSWARSKYGDQRRGPGTDASTVTITLILALAGLGAGIAASAWRVVA